MIWITTTFLLLIVCITLSYYLYKFLKIIMILEDDFSEAIETLEETEESIKGLLQFQLFFDNKEIKQLVMNVLEKVKLSQFALNKLIVKFVSRSKHKYVQVIEEKPSEELVKK